MELADNKLLKFESFFNFLSAYFANECFFKTENKANNLNIITTFRYAFFPHKECL